jgi:hypothetical protein
VTADPDAYREPLERAHAHALEWLASIPTRPVPPRLNAEQVAATLTQSLAEEGIDPVTVVDTLAAIAEPGLMAMSSGRFFGWVIGGTLPSAMAADWLVSAWDQNAAMRFATPATAAIEQAAGEMLLDLLGLPAESDVGFTTGGTTANFVGLAAGRQQVLDRIGWNLNADGLSGAPRITVFAGRERHASIDLALRYLGLGLPVAVDSDREGRIIPAALAEAMRDVEVRRSSASRRATFTREPSTRCASVWRSPTSMARGRMWTVPSACGRQRAPEERLLHDLERAGTLDRRNRTTNTRIPLV